MCGIAGFIGKTDTAESRLRAMVSALVRRGPDASAWKLWSEAGLGAARLAMVGGEAGAQPLQRRAEGPALVLNGEIYNWQTLDVASADGPPRSDTECALRCLEARGPAALSGFRGGFSLALWDPGSQRLLLARDEFGQKPLYYRAGSEILFFASSVKSLIAAGYRPRRDAEGLRDLAQLQFLRPDRTLFQGVDSVEPGQWIEFSRSPEGIARREGRFSYSEDGFTPSRLEGGERVEALAAGFREALELQAPGEHRAAVFLSGGLDSSVLTAGAMRQGLPIERALVGYFPDDSVTDERPHARDVAARVSLPLAEVELSARAWAEAWPKTIETLEMPFAGPGSVSQWILGREASDLGARIVYGGQGGDELFGGYERLRILQGLVSRGRPICEPAYAGLGEGMARAFRGGGAPAAYAAAIRRGVAATGDRAAPRFFGDPVDLERFMPWREDALAAAEEFERRIFLPGLLAVDDRCVAHFSMEGRLPFLDQRFAAIAKAVPLSEKSPVERPRQLFREAFGAWLPSSVADRQDKCGFAVPLASWFAGPLRGLVEEWLLEPRTLGRGLWTEAEARALLSDLPRQARLVFHLVSLEMWHRAFLESAEASSDSADLTREARV